MTVKNNMDISITAAMTDGTRIEAAVGGAGATITLDSVSIAGLGVESRARRGGPHDIRMASKRAPYSA